MEEIETIHPYLFIAGLFLLSAYFCGDDILKVQSSQDVAVRTFTIVFCWPQKRSYFRSFVFVTSQIEKSVKAILQLNVETWNTHFLFLLFCTKADKNTDDGVIYYKSGVKFKCIMWCAGNTLIQHSVYMRNEFLFDWLCLTGFTDTKCYWQLFPISNKPFRHLRGTLSHPHWGAWPDRSLWSWRGAESWRGHSSPPSHGVPGAAPRGSSCPFVKKNELLT